MMIKPGVIVIRLDIVKDTFVAMWDELKGMHEESFEVIEDVRLSEATFKGNKEYMKLKADRADIDEKIRVYERKAYAKRTKAKAAARREQGEAF